MPTSLHTDFEPIGSRTGFGLEHNADCPAHLTSDLPEAHVKLNRFLGMNDFPQLRTPRGRTSYLDHAGATLFSTQQLDAVHKDLLSSLSANPHRYVSSSFLVWFGAWVEEDERKVAVDFVVTRRW